MEVIAHQGDTVDALCWRHYGSRSGLSEAVFEANPGLAEHGPLLPHGTRVTLPDRPPPQPERGLINLWD